MRDTIWEFYYFTILVSLILCVNSGFDFGCDVLIDGELGVCLGCVGLDLLLSGWSFDVCLFEVCFGVV